MILDNFERINIMNNENNLDWDWDNLDEALAQFDGVVVEEGVDAAAEDDNCVGGACKI